MIKRKMKRYIILTLALAVGLPTFSQKLTVKKATVDCGRVLFQNPVKATFEVRNKGSKRITISDVQTSCGCTTADWPHGEIDGGDRFTISATYDAQQLGHFEKQVLVFGSASKEPLMLTMKGVVVAEMQDFSGSYPFDFDGLRVDKNELEFDNVNRGDKPVQELHVLNTSEKVCQPNLQHLPPYLTAKVFPERVAPGRTAKITVTLNSSAVRDYGLTQTNIFLASNLGDKVSRNRSIGVSTVLLPALQNTTAVQRQFGPRLSLSTTTLDLGAFEKKRKKSGEVLLTNNGRTPLDISSIQMFTEGLRVELPKRQIAAGETVKLKITAERDGIKRARSKPRVLMITNDPDHSKVVIEVKVKQ